MPRELPGYRDTLEMLMKLFPESVAISMDDAAKYYGVSKATLKRDKTFPVDAHNRVPIPRFARWLCL